LAAGSAAVSGKAADKKSAVESRSVEE